MIAESKHKQVRKYLESGRKLSGLQALKRFNIYRLAPVVFRLRHRDGVPVKTHIMGGSNHALYYL